jgi:hypothetical protein
VAPLIPAPRQATVGRNRVAVGDVRVAPASADLPAQGYRLRVDGEGVRVDAADATGEYYARQTLAQLVDDDGTAPECDIADWPDLAVRGVMLDVSRDKVPTMATLRALIDRLSGWKVNELQLYIEHTFAYTGHEDVWRDASAFTPDEIVDLDTYCAARHVTLTANQNCLAHMARWLRHPRYRSLGLRTEPFTMARIMPQPPATMDPTDPRSLAFARDLLAQLVPNFAHSDRVHVGLDEPFELPEERYGDYVDYLIALRAAPELDGKEMLVWGDILAGHRELIDKLPDGVTVAEWGYEAGHPFDDRLEVLARVGRAAWACPGTSSWNSLLGRTTNMRENQRSAARAAAAHGATGWLNTDWGDNGHLQYLPVSEPGFANGAAVSWCAATNADADVGADDSLMTALMVLGDAHTHAERQTPNMASYLLPLWFPHLRRAFATDDEFDTIEADLDAGAAAVAAAAVDRDDIDLVRAEVANAVALAKVLVDDGRGRNAGDGTLAGIDAGTRAALADRLDPVIAAHRDLWLARNRPGGLPDSTAWLERLRDSYRSGAVDADWMSPGLRAVGP